MEINGLSSAYLDNYRLSTSSKVNGPQNFDDILRRMKSSDSDSDSDVPSVKLISNRDIKIDKTDKLYGLCLELETFIIKNLLTTMRNTVQKSNLIDEGYAGKVYEDMLYDEYSKEFAKNAGLGLAEQAYKQLKQNGG